MRRRPATSGRLRKKQRRDEGPGIPPRWQDHEAGPPPLPSAPPSAAAAAEPRRPRPAAPPGRGPPLLSGRRGRRSGARAARRGDGGAGAEGRGQPRPRSAHSPDGARRGSAASHGRPGLTSLSLPPSFPPFASGAAPGGRQRPGRPPGRRPALPRRGAAGLAGPVPPGGDVGRRMASRGAVTVEGDVLLGHRGVGECNTRGCVRRCPRSRRPTSLRSL